MDKVILDRLALFNLSMQHVAPISWSWILRPIITKFGFGYKQSK